MTKPTKWHVHPTKTQISLGIGPVWSKSSPSDQPGHQPSLIRVFAVRMKKAWVLSYPLSAQRRLIRLGTQSFCWFCLEVAHKMAAICVIQFHPVNQKANDLETWYTASSARVLPSLFNDDPGLTLTYLRQRQIWSFMLLYGQKVKQWIFQKLLSSVIWN